MITNPTLTEAERHQLLVEWNNTQADYPRDLCIHQLFEVQVERTPEAIAVVYEDEQLSYRELNRRANQLAHYLIKCGVGSEVLVGICVERSLDMIVGLLGILKAGGAYVPLDPGNPLPRLCEILQDTSPPVLLVQKNSDRFDGCAGKTISLDDDWKYIEKEDAANFVSTASQTAQPITFLRQC